MTATPDTTVPATLGCDGHWSHHFEPIEECRYCGHPRSEHRAEGFWEDNRAQGATESESRLLDGNR